MIQQRASEREAKKAGDLLIKMATDPRLNNLSLTRYLEAQQLPVEIRKDIALILVMALVGVSRGSNNVINQDIYQMIGPYYRSHLMPGTE